MYFIVSVTCQISSFSIRLETVHHHNLNYFLFRFQFEQLFFHWGRSGSATGSEHSLDKSFFPAELQMFGFNAHLFRNLSEASQHPHGAVAVAVMIKEADRERAANREIKAVTEHLKKVSICGSL
jgi:hypothetical protein